MAISTVTDLIVDQLGDLYDAEKQLTRALPKLAKAANDPELAQGFRDHLEQTKRHVVRIEEAFQSLGKKARGKTCPAMKGLVEEGAETIEEELEGEIGDLALIACARRVEHYEQAAYDHLVSLSQGLNNPELVSLLQETLKEEQETDKKLSLAAVKLLKASNRGTRSAGAMGAVEH